MIVGNSVFSQSLSFIEHSEDHILLNVEDSIQIVEIVDAHNARTEVEVAYDAGEILLSNLFPGSIYTITYVDDEGNILKDHFSTISRSTGEIETYFNYEIVGGNNASLIPNGTTYAEVEKALRNLIKSAKSSIDYCAYNTNVTSIANELIDAHNRGVRVRVIVERQNNNSAFDGSFPFEILEDTNNDLMHNKFIIVDSDDELNAHVVNGSMNFTRGQMEYDPNHLLIIQDQSLARAYETEFEEMWGSSDAQYDLSKSKFGNKKSNNTPKNFTIGGRNCKLYFSPSDNTTFRIAETLGTADYTIDAGLLLFTSWDLRDKLKEILNQDVRVRMIVEDEENSSSVISQLKGLGALTEYHYGNAIYHHKMAIIDAENEDSNPTIVTGSHNWTYTAETKNDENTMIIEDALLADLFRRAFVTHWRNLSTNTIYTSWDKMEIYPNPSIDFIYLKDQNNYDYEVINQLGEIIMKGRYQDKIDINHLPSSKYFLRLSKDSDTKVFPIIKL